MTAPVLERILQAMKSSKGVPATERSVASVLGALDSTEEGKQRVVSHIIEDFALTQKVLKLANSSMYAPFSSGSSSVSSAVDVLGSEAVLHLALGTDLVSDEELRNDEHLSQTLMASELARSACADRAEDASIATLMYEIGRLMTGKYLPAETKAIAAQVAAGASAEEAALKVLGVSFQDLGVELAARWNLPQTLRDTISGVGDPTLVGIARFSSSASALIAEGKSEAAMALLQDLDLPGIDKSRLNAVVSSQAEYIRKTRPERQTVSNETRLDALLQDLQKEQKATVEDVAKTLLPGISEVLHTAHCLLFMVTRSGEMRVRCAYGKGIDEIKSRLRISAEFMPTAFHASIKNRMDVSIADVSKLKDASLPEGYRSLLPTVTKFIILPIANSRVSGLLYCDWDSSIALKPAEMDSMKRLREFMRPYFPA
jgi:HD-like signal output (HDOD) protein